MVQYIKPNAVNKQPNAVDNKQPNAVDYKQPNAVDNY